MGNEDLKLDVKALLVDLNGALNKDFSVMEDSELESALSKVVYLEEKLVFNLIDWSLSNLHLISSAGLKCVKDIRSGLTSMSLEVLRGADVMAPLVLEVVEKLDALDDSKRLGDILLRALSV